MVTMVSTETSVPSPLYEHGRLYEMPLADLMPNPNQPRKFIDPAVLTELTAVEEAEAAEKYSVSKWWQIRTKKSVLLQRRKMGKSVVMPLRKRCNDARQQETGFSSSFWSSPLSLFTLDRLATGADESIIPGKGRAIMKTNKLQNFVIFIAFLAAFIPFIVHAATTWQQTNGPYGGAIYALAIDPSSPQTIYAGTLGGVFKSVNGGGSWSAVSTGLTNIPYVRTLAIDPSKPQTIYAGTNGGVFKSVNGGGSWSTVSTGLTSSDIRSLAIDPSNPQTVYAGTDGGVFKSVNGGTNWSAVSTGLTSSDIRSLAIDPSTPQTIYAGTDGGVFKSVNGGGNWSAINTGMTGTYIESLMIDPSTPQTIYVGMNSGGIFKSVNGGGNWSAVNTGMTSTYVKSLIVDPSTSQTIYAGTLGGVFKSIDGAENWGAVNAGLTGTSVLSLATDSSTPQTVYAGTNGGGIFKSINSGENWSAVNAGLPAGTDVRSLITDPSTPQTIYAGTHLGVFKSVDGGEDWSAAQTGLANKYVLSLVIDPSNPQTIYAGTWGAGVYKSGNGGGSWSAVNTGLSASTDVPSLIIDPSTPQILYAGTNGGVFKSVNGGGSWSIVNTGLTSTYIRSLIIDPSTPQILYAGTHGGIFKSVNGGENWSAVNTGLTSTFIESLIVDPSTPQTIYAGMNSGGVFMSVNGGASWSAVGAGMTGVRSLAIDPSTPQTLYAGTFGWGVFKTQFGKGDINADGQVNLTDAVLALQTLSSSQTIAHVHKEADVDGDNKIGIAEAIYALQCIARLRNNHSPVLNPIGNKMIDEGSTLSFTISATDADNDPLIFTISNLPSGAAFNAGNGTFSWTPSYSQSGTYQVSFEADDGYGGIDSETITITVNDLAPPNAPSTVSASSGNTQAIISWSPVAGATSYNIYWSATSGVNKSTGTKISNVTSPYTHTNLTNGSIYYYIVTSINAAGESAESDQVSAHPQSAVIATETWNGSFGDGAGAAQFIFVKTSDGITASGAWTYGPTVCPFVSAPMTISGTSFHFIASGTAITGSDTSGFTATVNGIASGGQASGTYSVIFDAPGWSQQGSPYWTATRISGSGITN